MPENVTKKEGFEISREGGEEILKIDANKWMYSPSIEDNGMHMSKLIDILAENPSITRVIFNQKRNYGYDSLQTEMLVQVASVYNHLIKQQKVLTIQAVGGETRYTAERFAAIQNIILNLLRTDPLGAYVQLKRLIREEKIRQEGLVGPEARSSAQYLRTLNEIYNMIDSLKLINLARDYLEGYEVGERSVYRELFRPTITPDFMYARLMAKPPTKGKQLDMYSVGDTEVTVYQVPGDIKYLYHIIPPEFKISEDEYQLLDLARAVLVEHKPREEEFLDPKRMRDTFTSIGRDLLLEIARNRGKDVPFERLEELSKILVRYTVGFGMIEILLQDEKVQDIVINGPIGQTPVFLVHQDYDECVTNIVPSAEDAEGWATKFRLLSGRPLDEANPVLDTELTIPGARSRTAIITSPLNPWGLAYALRRHRDKPWTYPLFITKKMINPLGAGLMSFLIDGARTILIAGTRSSGKTSFLGATLVEIMRKYRILTVEDTLELPTRALKELGYNIQPMKVRAALTGSGAEVPADEGIRTSLRLGDSSLIVGEVRSLEAKALYEAMRVGALANVVAGTIHGGSPYGVFDRVVNDLGVPRTSFKATDIIVVANPIRSPDGMEKWKRIVQITEVRKHWEDDPLAEGGFVDLMKYDPKTDQLEPSQDLINGESEVMKDIAGSVKLWAGNWDAVWENVELRAKIKETLVSHATKLKMMDILEAPFVINSNDQFHRISDEVRRETGALDSERIFKVWDEWLKKEIKEKRFNKKEV